MSSLINKMFVKKRVFGAQIVLLVVLLALLMTVPAVALAGRRHEKFSKRHHPITPSTSPRLNKKPVTPSTPPKSPKPPKKPVTPSVFIPLFKN